MFIHISRFLIADFGPWPCTARYDVCCRDFLVSSSRRFPWFAKKKTLTLEVRTRAISDVELRRTLYSRVTDSPQVGFRAWSCRKIRMASSGMAFLEHFRERMSLCQLEKDFSGEINDVNGCYRFS